MLDAESLVKRLRAGSPSGISTDAGGNSSSSSTQQGAQLVSVVTEIEEPRVSAMVSFDLQQAGTRPCPRMPGELQLRPEEHFNGALLSLPMQPAEDISAGFSGGITRCRLPSPQHQLLPEVLTDLAGFGMQASPAKDWPPEAAWRSARTAKRAGHLLAASQATSVP